MALSENGGMNYSMPVAPTGFGGGFGSGDWSWIIILLIFGMFGGGWGGGFGGYEFPWVLNGQQNTDNNVNNGFRDQMINSGINGIQQSVTGGFGDLQTALCGGFASVNASINGAQNALAQQMYSNQIAELERSFAAQSANSAALSGLSQQLSTCCCDNRLATCQTQNLVSTEGAATRLAIQQQTQAILDKMCAQEIDNLKAQNIALQNQVNMQSLVASQTAQTAALVADNTAQTQYIVNRVAPYPIPAYTVANPVTPAAASTT